MTGPEGRRWLVATTEYAGVTPYTGGIGRHYASLLPALVAAGESVDLVLFSGEDLLPGADLRGVRLIAHERLAGVPAGRRPAARARRVRTAYLAGRYDRVFLPEWGALGAALPRRAPLVTNLATSTALVLAGGGLALRELPRDERAVTRTLLRAERRQVRRSAAVIAISRAMRERSREVFGMLPPARVVPNCIDVDAVQANAASAPLPSGWPPGPEPVVLFLGRAERRKGVIDAALAFARVAAEVPGARLVFAGAGGDDRFEPSRDHLRALLPPETRERMTWLGHVGGAELYAAVARADVVLCPSRWEGFGQVALEAKAIGAPLVATSGSGFDDFCVDGVDSILVPPADPGALAEAVVRLLRDPDEARSLGATARAHAGEYAPAPVAARLIAAVDELVPVGG